MASISYTDLKDLTHDPELAKALGNMVIAWANAEAALVWAFAAIAGITPNMAIMGYYRIPTFEARTKFLRALIEDWETTKYDKDAIFTEIEKINGLSKARNDWIHGVWCIGSPDKDTVIFDFRATDESGKRRKPVKAADVENHNLAVSGRTDKLRALIPDVP